MICLTQVSSTFTKALRLIILCGIDMTANDMPDDLLGMIRNRFETDPSVVKLRLHQKDLQARGKYMEALDIAKQIESIFNDVVFRYMKETEKSISKVDVGKMDIPAEDKERVQTLGVVMFMACDIIDFAVMDVDDILHKYDKELCFEMFNDIREISTLAKEKLKFFQKNSGYMKGLAWADKCDDMYSMIQSKARSIVKRNKNKS